MCESTRVIINAGGKIFEVSTTTLLASGSGYFEALLGSSGEAMRAGKKRARVGGDGDDPPAEIFVDRDPDIFGDVLKYMRANCLPAAVAADAHRLHDLKVEAEFLAYDRLVTACDEAEAALPRARMITLCVAKGTGTPDSNDAWGDLESIDVPAGEVLYVTHVAPYFDGLTAAPTHAAIQACLEDRSVNVQIAQCVVTAQDAHQAQLNLNSSGSFSKTIVMDGGEHGKVLFRAAGSTWCVQGWVGHPSKIPGLSSKI
jgi:hypothetical protein